MMPEGFKCVPIQKLEPIPPVKYARTDNENVERVVESLRIGPPLAIDDSRKNEYTFFRYYGDMCGP